MSRHSVVSTTYEVSNELLELCIAEPARNCRPRLGTSVASWNIYAAGGCPRHPDHSQACIAQTSDRDREHHPDDPKPRTLRISASRSVDRRPCRTAGNPGANVVFAFASYPQHLHWNQE